MSALEPLARKFIVPLGYPADADWKRIFVGNMADSIEGTGSLYNLCIDLARAATDYPRVGIDRERRAIALLDNLEREGGAWVAVRVENTGWEVVRPRSQDALKDACATANHLRCEHCDDTGDVTRIDGEWLGYCDCPAGVALKGQPHLSAGSGSRAVEVGSIMPDPHYKTGQDITDYLDAKEGLKACPVPWCGAPAWPTVLSTAGQAPYAVRCSKCYLLAPRADTEAAARAAWNTRKDQADG